MSSYSVPFRKFKEQAKAAKQRGIEWQLTYEQWLEIWMESGKWHQRGKRIGQYVMSRKGDVGAYAVGNVFICLHSENVKDGYRNKPGKHGGHLTLGMGKGWFMSRGKYVACVRHNVIGRFRTQAEAEAAYQAKVAEIKAAA